MLKNVQPFVAGYRFGSVGIAHNGNLVNYQTLRAMLEDNGSIFNTTSDTEVVLHLIAISKARPFVMRIVEACEQLKGAYSMVFLTEDKSVYKSRYAFGEILATVAPVEYCDMVISVPDSGNIAAYGYAAKAGVPYHQGLTRRVRVVVVDDWIVRGTTALKIVRLIKEAGAKEVHMRIASPPIIASCYYGVDTPNRKELTSNRMHDEELREFIGRDSLAFLPLESLMKYFGSDSPNYCYACFSGNYPVDPSGELGDFSDDGLNGSVESGYEESSELLRSDGAVTTQGLVSQNLLSVSDQYLENPFQVSGPKGAYEAKKVEEGLFVRMEMPGIEKDDVQISVEYNNVKIKGEGKKESKHEDSGRSYSGGIELCSNVFQPQKIEAEKKNGVLRMIIPRAKTSDYKDSGRSFEIRVK
ncbi:hypothetical protein RJ639_028046 [Escallonia herrerae]|uniref:Amidophosphoribosyltransferase n=1 Tax=Escallonia herrerae TaxID=1293975 RepID=A0AA89BDM2_9ASTE|nr:hypothetical protein RJ639_028046 [Escallonia herrerae]